MIPYVCDQLAMAQLPRATYALFVALLPATATVIGVIVLGQLPSLVDLGGIALVMAGVALHRPERGDGHAASNAASSTPEVPAAATGSPAVARAAAPIETGPTASSATAAKEVAMIMNVQPLRKASITPAGEG